MDKFSREALAIMVDHSLKADPAVDTVTLIEQIIGLPKRIEVGNASEFNSKALDTIGPVNKARSWTSQGQETQG